MDATALRQLGEIHHAQGRLEQARALLAEAGSLHRTVADRAGEAETHLRVAEVNRDAGQPSTDPAETALTIARELRDSQLEADALNTLASIQDRLGQHQQAIDHYGQAYKISNNAELTHPQAQALIGLAAAYLHAGDHKQAHSHVNRALNIARGCGYRLLADKASTLLAALHGAEAPTPASAGGVSPEGRRTP
jgi:tetratricopeptide (TPR) repeat protein